MAALENRIVALKKKLVEATDFDEIAELFLEDLGNDLAFMKSGKRYSDEAFVTALAETAAAVLEIPVGVYQGTLRRVARYRMIHGAFTIGEWTAMMFFFEDLDQGFLAAGDAEGPSRFVRFSFIPKADGKKIPIH
jgi:hypothetical protein